MIDKKVSIGRFGSVYGIHGWLKVIAYTQPAANIFNYFPWYIQITQTWQPLKIAAYKEQGKHLLVKLEGCESPEQARQYTNIEISIDRSQLPALASNDYYWTDLEGLKVVNTQGIEFGYVDHLFSTGANDILVIKGQKEILIPYLKHVVMEVNLATQTLTVDWDASFIE